MTDENKAYYTQAHDQIRSKRFDSPYPIRRRVHREMYESVMAHVPEGATVLDAGCGEGVLSVLMAQRGFDVVGVDLSVPNIDAAQDYLEGADLSGQVCFQTGDAENLPFDDDAFDCVVSNHVLEHLPSFEAGLRELYRVTRRHVVVAVPTCLNPAAWALLGKDNYWKLGKRTPFAVSVGLGRVLWAALSGQVGVDEGYGAGKEQIHIFRFPRVLKDLAEQIGFKVVAYHAQTIPMPYLNVSFSRYASAPVWRNLGLGTVYVLEKPAQA